MGIWRNEQLSNTDLIVKNIARIRPLPVILACPDHSEKRTLFDCSMAENNAGSGIDGIFLQCIRCERERALFFAFPQANISVFGQIGRDQVIDYATRRCEAVATVEKRLAPVAYNVR